MPTFRPPTYPVPYPHRPPLSQFWRYWTYEQGAAVLVKDGIAETRMYPYQGDLEDGGWDHIYLGGYDHQISDEEATLLTSQGYGEFIT